MDAGPVSVRCLGAIALIVGLNLVLFITVPHRRLSPSKETKQLYRSLPFMDLETLIWHNNKQGEEDGVQHAEWTVCCTNEQSSIVQFVLAPEALF